MNRHVCCFAATMLCALSLDLAAQEPSARKFEVYGFAMMDAGHNLDQIDPLWFDVVRPTKLPSFENEFGPDGTTFFSVRQSRFGTRATVPTNMGELKAVLEWELFGTGVDAGQTTLRLRHAYGQLGSFGAGQTWSPFMDIDIFPNSIEYWGPNGMPFFRNVQVFWMPVRGTSRVTFALERPGASADQGLATDRIALEDVRPHFPWPDFSAEFRYGAGWGYLELAGIVRHMEWDDIDGDPVDISGSELGWGATISSNIKLGARDLIRLQAVYGEGVQNYMNDAPQDVGVEFDADEPGGIRGVALPVFGGVAFLEHAWSSKVTTAIGYSIVDIDNSDLQSPSAFKQGQYALGNVLWTPVPDVMTGIEFQWGDRENFSDGFTTDIMRIQLSFKYSFSQTF